MSCKKLKRMPIELLEKIRQYRKYLFYGDIKQIANETRRTPNYVTMNLSGDRYSLPIIAAIRNKAISNARAMGVELN
jgi:hypothetical protein